MTIVDAHGRSHLPMVRKLFREYAEDIGVDLCFQGFERELAELPGRYAAPEGRLWLALQGRTPAGCVALRKIGDGICEMKRLFVRPAFRGEGLGRRLAQQIIAAAKVIGYQRMRLDTLASMQPAIALYKSLGFQHTAPYYRNPNGNAVFLELTLRSVPLSPSPPNRPSPSPSDLSGGGGLLGGENSPNQDFAHWPPEPPPHPIPRLPDHPLPHRGRGQGEGATGDRTVHGKGHKRSARQRCAQGATLQAMRHIACAQTARSRKPVPARWRKEVARLLITERMLARRIREMSRAIERDFRGRELVVVSLLNGTVMFLADLIRHLSLPLRLDFIGVSSYGAGTESGELVFTKELRLDVRGRDVLLVDDILDTGKTMSRVLPKLRALKPRRIKVCVLLDKPSRRVECVTADYVGFEIPDMFVVGYGLDFAERYRNLPFVGVLHPHVHQPAHNRMDEAGHDRSQAPRRPSR